MTTQNELNERIVVAQDALDGYDFGEGVSIVGHGQWDMCDPDDLIKTLYASYDNDSDDAESNRLSFHARFSNGTLTEAYALDVKTGNEIGFMPHPEACRRSPSIEP